MIDARKQEFERTVAEFARKGRNADMALFFYAGHAMQHQGRNYLMPVDGELKDGDSIWSMIRLDDVREALDRVSGLKVMILDACRNNPLSDRLYRSPGGGGAQRGLARIDRTQGMIVVYATAADEVAEDGNGRNSPFTNALLTRMDEAGLEITKMLKLVGADVSAHTAGRQRPEISVQSYNDYFLNQSDRSAWEKIRDSGDPSALQDFIKRFPSSPYSPVARDRLQRLALSAPDAPNGEPKPVPAVLTPHDPSSAAPTLPPAPQDSGQVSPPTGDQVPSPALDGSAVTTPSNRPDRTEGKPHIRPSTDQAGNETGKQSGAGTRKGGTGASDGPRPGKGGDRGRPGAGPPSAAEAGSTKARQQQMQQTLSAKDPAPSMKSPMVMGQAF